MYLTARPNRPCLPIKSPYFLLSFSGLALIALAAVFIPKHADAFWPFSNASAAGASFVPDPSTPTLAAATNVDPNPDKGLGDSIQISDNAMLAYTGPSGTIADVISLPSSDRISIYVVRPGDTLSEIATMFGVSVNTVIWANNLKGISDIHAGDTLIILPVSGTKRTVVKGDTLKSLAKKYNADATEIAQFNGLDENASLAVGTTIIIPGGEISVPTPTKSTGSKKNLAKSGDFYEPYLGGSGAAQSGYYGNPVPGAIITQSIHGWNAVDFGAARGTPIYAAAAGRVIVAKSNGAWNGGYGNYVVISHGNDTQTLYAHMTRTATASGQAVTKGQLIGYIGSTGLSTGAHLHFEVRGAANPLRNCGTGRSCAAQ